MTRKKRPAHRPSKLYQEPTRSIILNALANGHSRSEAARLAGIPEPTLLNALNASRQVESKEMRVFREDADKAEMALKVRSLAVVTDRLQGGDGAMARFVLERRFRDEWGAHANVDVRDADGILRKVAEARAAYSTGPEDAEQAEAEAGGEDAPS